jgi:hypothetical protein
VCVGVVAVEFLHTNNNDLWFIYRLALTCHGQDTVAYVATGPEVWLYEGMHSRMVRASYLGCVAQ